MPAPRVRIAPSPTGPLHIGTARTALFNYLFARRHNGTFVLRLEDTDVARSTVGFEADILEQLNWLGITWDEGPDHAGGEDRGPFGPYRQMQRLDRYAEAAADLLARDLAYPCFCTPEELDADRKAQEAAHQPPRYVGRCTNLTADERADRVAQGRPAALRFRVRADKVRFDDLVRGEDHLSNTPKHILLFEALGHGVPAFAHLPLILNPDRTKMSKRKSQTAIADYRAQGFVPEAMVNYLALLGWSTGTEEEILGLEELTQRFDLDHVQKGGAVFDRERLEWLNGQWIRRLEPDELIARLEPFLGEDLRAGRIDRLPAPEELRPLIPIIQERLPTLGAIGDLVGFLWLDTVTIDPAMLVPKRWDRETTLTGLRAARESIASAGAVAFEADELEPPMRALAEANGWKAGDLFMAVRVAVTGRTAAPPLFDSLVALGRERVLARLDTAIDTLERSEVTA